MTTEQSYNNFFNQLLPLYESKEANNIADWVFENVTGLKRWERRAQKNKILTAELVQRLQKYLEELLRNKPVQYVLQEAWFYKMKFFVNEHVLIPRPETEELVSWVVNDLRTAVNDMRNGAIEILDVGTGSGCIAISFKKELKNIFITAIDISKEALTVAKKNADNLQTPIAFLRMDFIDERSWNAFGVYDVIVSNPPYIPEIEKETLAKNVTAYEPGIALFVQNDHPFIFYEKIAKFAQSHLKPGGRIFVEVHEGYSNEVRKIFSVYNFNTEMKKDIYGKARMVRAISNGP
ncbi:MAG: peptide chain release factor N(5)-glutamine methyltransferase [Ginsengibacter sp.]